MQIKLMAFCLACVYDNIEKCFLDTGRVIAPDSKPSELLSQAIEPPRIENIHEAIETLADMGAIERKASILSCKRLFTVTWNVTRFLCEKRRCDSI